MYRVASVWLLGMPRVAYVCLLGMYSVAYVWLGGMYRVGFRVCVPASALSAAFESDEQEICSTTCLNHVTALG